MLKQLLVETIAAATTAKHITSCVSVDFFMEKGFVNPIKVTIFYIFYNLRTEWNTR